MRRVSAILGTFGIKVIFAAALVLMLQPAYSQAAEVALLLQQTPSQGGIISPEVGVHQFQLNSEVTIVAIPKPGYQFVYWLGDVADPTAIKTTAYLDKPKVVIAVFQQVDDDQMIVGQNPATGGGGGGDFTDGGSVMNIATSRSSGGGGFSSGGGGGSNPPTEGDDPTPPDGPPDGPPDDPPEVPEPATGVLLALGALALARKRTG